jgi:hypothetical protein
VENDLGKYTLAAWIERGISLPTDMTDSEAETMLIEPRTRLLLEPIGMLESGEIKPLPMRGPDRCGRGIRCRQMHQKSTSRKRNSFSGPSLTEYLELWDGHTGRASS